jgi:hypothetical protein
LLSNAAFSIAALAAASSRFIILLLLLLLLLLPPLPPKNPAANASRGNDVMLSDEQLSAFSAAVTYQLPGKEKNDRKDA